MLSASFKAIVFTGVFVGLSYFGCSTAGRLVSRIPRERVLTRLSASGAASVLIIGGMLALGWPGSILHDLLAF